MRGWVSALLIAWAVAASLRARKAEANLSEAQREIAGQTKITNDLEAEIEAYQNQLRDYESQIENLKRKLADSED